MKERRVQACGRMIGNHGGLGETWDRGWWYCTAEVALEGFNITSLLEGNGLSCEPVIFGASRAAKSNFLPTFERGSPNF